MRSAQTLSEALGDLNIAFDKFVRVIIEDTFVGRALVWALNRISGI